MDLKLKGKSAFVAGASRGLGYAVARGLLMEGCRVAINARNNSNLESAANKLRAETGGEVVPLAGDVADPVIPAQLINSTINALGSLDLLVTNAGGPPAGQFESIEDDVWQKAIDLSLMSHVRLIRAALPYLKTSQAGSVLTITSYSVKQPIPNLVLSNSIRAATVGLTKTLALEVGSAGIRFNSILPGWTDTERVTELMTSRSNQNNTSIEAEFARQAKESPLGRMATPEEFANAAVFLLSPAASYITGVMLSVDGGMVKGTL
jgi:3-oxoacyl-[acyl-carrier protein] reductase